MFWYSQFANCRAAHHGSPYSSKDDFCMSTLVSEGSNRKKYEASLYSVDIVDLRYKPCETLRYYLR